LLALNVPQAPAVVLPQAAVQLAPLVSLTIVAVSDSVPPTAREVGVGLGFVVSEMVGAGGGGVVVEGLELLLHPTRAAIMLKLMTRRIDLQNVIVRKVIGHPR
jgi:hypothetical protein